MAKVESSLHALHEVSDLKPLKLLPYSRTAVVCVCFFPIREVCAWTTGMMVELSRIAGSSFGKERTVLSIEKPRAASIYRGNASLCAPTDVDWSRPLCDPLLLWSIMTRYRTALSDLCMNAAIATSMHQRVAGSDYQYTSIRLCPA